MKFSDLGITPDQPEGGPPIDCIRFITLLTAPDGRTQDMMSTFNAQHMPPFVDEQVLVDAWERHNEEVYQHVYENLPEGWQVDRTIEYMGTVTSGKLAV